MTKTVAVVRTTHILSYGIYDTKESTYNIDLILINISCRGPGIV